MIIKHISKMSKHAYRFPLHTALLGDEVILALPFLCICSFDSHFLLFILFSLFFQTVAFFSILPPTNPNFFGMNDNIQFLTNNIAHKEKAYVHQHLLDNQPLF